MTSTERLLKARGVSSIAELEGTGKIKASKADSPSNQALSEEEETRKRFAEQIAAVDLTKDQFHQPNGVRPIAYEFARRDEADQLEASLRAAGVGHPSRPVWEDCDSLQSLDELEAHIAKLKTLASINSVKISRPSATHSKAVSGDDGGFGSTGRTGKSSNGEDRPTATARALQAKGISTLAELEAKKRVSPCVVSVESPNAEQVKEAVAVLAAAIMGKPKTSTEKLLAAAGVNTLEELAELRRKQRGGKRLGKTVALLVFAALMFCGAARAQMSGPKVLLAGGTNSVAAMSTNATLYLACDEYNDMGLQLSAASTSGSTSNILVRVWRTIASQDQETSVFTNLVLTLNGTATNTAFAVINVSGAASVRLQVASTNAAGFATNLNLVARFKAPKIKISSN